MTPSAYTRDSLPGDGAGVADDPQPELCEEARLVVRRRREEAAAAGLSILEARLYAESNIDASDLRRLVKAKCPPAMIARLLF